MLLLVKKRNRNPLVSSYKLIPFGASKVHLIMIMFLIGVVSMVE